MNVNILLFGVNSLCWSLLMVMGGEAIAQITPSSPSVNPRTLEPNRPNLNPLPDQPLPNNSIPLSPPINSGQPLPNLPAQPNSTIVTVQVKQIKVLGSTAFSEIELANITAPFIGKSATFDQLLDIRTAVTNLYTSRGYTTSGAFLPPQDVSSGIIAIQVVEGELERLEIAGLAHLKESYVRDRINLVTQAPVNIKSLESALQLLQIDPLFNSVQAELKAGTSPGRSVLVLNLKEAKPIRSELAIENRDSPSVGAIRYSANFTDINLLGYGDRFDATVGFTSGINSYSVGYEFPINSRNGTMGIRYSNDSSQIIEQPFSPLDINGRTQTLSFNFRQPITRTPSQEFTLGLGLDLRDSQTYVLGDVPFSFSTGPENGKSKITALRFSQEYVTRSLNQVLALRSQFSLGIGAFGATVNDTGTDGRFFSWLGQAQLVQSLATDTLLISRLAAQFTPSSLLPLEQFSIGGVETVRGYRQNRLVGDNAVVGSVEARFPLLRNGDSLLQITPFFDVGTAWNNKGLAFTPSLLASIGLGLRYQLGSSLFFRIDYGLPLNRVNQPGNSVEDSGLFFSVRAQL